MHRREDGLVAEGFDENRFRTAFETAPIGIIIADAAGRAIDVNPTFQQMVGYSLEELRGTLVSEVTHPDDVAASRAAADRIRKGQMPHARLEKRYLHKKGSAVWCRVDMAAVRDGSGTVRQLVAMIQDITEHKATEDALRESQRAMATLVSNIPGMAYRCRNDPDWTMEFLSEGCLELTGYRPDELVVTRATSYGQIIHPDDRQDVWDRVQEALAEGRPFQLTYRIITRDGRTKWVWEQGRGVFAPNGQLLALEGLITDISDSKRAQEALAESESMLSSIIDQSPISTWILDADGTLIRQNAACRRLLGVTDEQTIGIYNVFRDQTAAREGRLETIRKVYTEGRPARFTSEYDVGESGCVDVPPRQRRLLDVTIFPVIDETGEVRYAVGQHEDITQLRDKEEQLRQAQKMEAIGKLVGGITHDFNNQLTIVKGYCELLLAGLATDDPMYEPIEQILKAANRSTALTSQLLAYSRKQALHPQLLNLSGMLREMAEPVRKVLGDSVELSLDLAGDLGQVRVDPVQVQQAIMNVIVNARDAMPDGGRLTLATANVDLTRGESASPEAPGGPFVMLAIRDTGIGMDEQTREHMFDPFFTTKLPGFGTGMGPSARAAAGSRCRAPWGRAPPSASTCPASPKLRRRNPPPPDPGALRFSQPLRRRIVWRHVLVSACADLRQGSAGSAGHPARGGRHARVHARRHGRERQGRHARPAPGHRGHDAPGQHLPPDAPPRGSDRRGTGRAAPLHGLGRSPPDRQRRLPGILARPPAADRR
jgi:two-component system cell cycle sensor histidine kinase/response regulator CckA